MKFMNPITLQDGRRINVAKLAGLLCRRVPRYVEIATLWKTGKSPRDPTSGFSPFRYSVADYRLPIIVTLAGEVIDGRHRILKCYDLGGNELAAKIATESDLQQCLC